MIISSEDLREKQSSLNILGRQSYESAEPSSAAVKCLVNVVCGEVPPCFIIHGDFKGNDLARN